MAIRTDHPTQTTTHATTIHALRGKAAEIFDRMESIKLLMNDASMETHPVVFNLLNEELAEYRRQYNRTNAAAALLEVHDQTGLNITTFDGVLQFVEDEIGRKVTPNNA